MKETTYCHNTIDGKVLVVTCEPTHKHTEVLKKSEYYRVLHRMLRSALYGVMLAQALEEHNCESKYSRRAYIRRLQAAARKQAKEITRL